MNEVCELTPESKMKKRRKPHRKKKTTISYHPFISFSVFPFLFVAQEGRKKKLVLCMCKPLFVVYV